MDQVIDVQEEIFVLSYNTQGAHNFGANKNVKRSHIRIIRDEYDLHGRPKGTLYCLPGYWHKRGYYDIIRLAEAREWNIVYVKDPE